PDSLSSPSPNSVWTPFSLRANSCVQLALCKAPNTSSSVASGVTNNRLSLMVPANTWASWVTKPLCRLISFYRAVSAGIALNKMRPETGRYSPTSSLTRVDLPDPEGPSNAMVSPLFTVNEILSMAFSDAVLCLNTTWSKTTVSKGPIG